MSTRLAITDLDVEVTATLLGCKAGSGLVNMMNDLKADGLVEDGDTYGWIQLQVLTRMLSRLGNVTRKPVTTTEPA